MNDKRAIVQGFLQQARWCRKLGSELYATILEAAGADLACGGIVADVLAPYERDASESALPLRFLAAVHRIALRGDAPALAAFYPSCAGSGNITDACAPFMDTVKKNFAEVRTGSGLGVQTNEVNRAAALLCGFLFVAARTKLPLRIFEIGASAGLNLRWDRYRYVWGDRQWGSADARLVLRDNFEGAPPPFAAEVSIVERRGCDLSPIDPRTSEGRQMLTSFVWPDQISRLDQLERACSIASTVPALVDRADAVSWLASDAFAPARGTATVVFHSVTAQYLSTSDRDALGSRIAQLASQASAEAPFAHLSMEPPEYGARLSLWPGVASMVVAQSTPHGQRVRHTIDPSVGSGAY